MTRRSLTAAISLLVVTSAVAGSPVAASARTEPASRAAPPKIAATQELATVKGPLLAHGRPSLQARTTAAVPARTPITGERTTLPVLGSYGNWLLVQLPGRPNGHSGWIDGRQTVSSVTAWHLVVATAARTVTIYHAGRVVRVVKAVVGKPGTPTPAGASFVEEAVALDGNAVGAPFALALGARSDVLQDFDGGPGQIALHGLANVGGVPGTAASHGCVRIDNATMRWLAHRIGPGVPVTIT